jgi:Fe2+ or Zn2+ uptake regulation protein
MARRSPVRDSVRALLEEQERRPWSAEELLTEMARRHIRGDYSTVFRALSALEREGVAARVDLGDGRQRFEAKTEPHEHIRCQRCGRIAEVPDCLLGDSASRVRRLTGFVVTQHRLLLSGLCPSCRSLGREELRRQISGLQ